MAEAAKKEEAKTDAAKKDAAGAAGAAGAAKPKADFLSLIMFVLVLVTIGAVGGMGYFMQQMWHRLQDIQTNVSRIQKPEETKANPIGKELQPQNLGALYPMESFLVNIASDQGPKFLQTQMEFELVDAIVEDELSRKKPAVRDAVIVLLSSRSYKELREPAGMRKLRTDLVRVVNNLLSTGKIREVYFTQFHFN